MIFGYESFCNKVKKEGKEKYKEVVYGNDYGNMIKCFILYFFLLIVFLSFSLKVFLICWLISFICFIIFVSNQKIGFAFNNSCILLVKFGLFFKVRKVFEINVNELKYLSLKKMGSLNFVRFSFMDNMKIRKSKVIFNDFVLFLSLNEQRKNGKVIFSRLREVEKVLDRGDF